MLVIRACGAAGLCHGIVAAFFAIFIFAAAAQVHAQQNTAIADLALAAKGEWDATTTYAKDDIVTARGSTWLSLKAGNKNKVPGQTNVSTAAWWQLFARGLNPTGAWSNATKYQPDDLVINLGATWRAKRTNINRATVAGADWEQVAAKGSTGPAGPNTGVGGGSQSVPSISFNGDADTGIYSPAPGQIALVEDGGLFLHNIGNQNTALGFEALFLNNGNGAFNTAIGAGALFHNSTGSDNTAVGAHALVQNTGGISNTAMGSSALSNNTFGSDNTALGFNALIANTTGGDNTAVGSQALLQNTGGVGNTALGKHALASNSSGANNTAVGSAALASNATGNLNTALGESALASNAGNNNVALGESAGLNPTAASDSIFIGNLGVQADTAVIRIGTQPNQSKTFIAGIRGKTTSTNDAVAVLIDSNGQLGTTSSSRRYKQDIQPMGDASVPLLKLRPVTFRYKKSYGDGTKPIQYGLIAEEVAEVFPDLAAFNKDGTAETVKYHLLPALLLNEYQRQQKTIAAQAVQTERQQKTIESQAEQMAALQRRLSALETRLAHPVSIAGLPAAP
jgi:hypothetical protein